jgi:hypothetical protein
MNLYRLGAVALLAGCIAWPATALASSQRAHHARSVAAGSQTYTDPAGDSGNAPDVTNVTVSNDDNGQLTFAITLPNRAAFTAADFMSLDMDTNGNLSDGVFGADYSIGIDQNGVLLFSDAAGAITPLTAQTLTSSFANTVETISINRSEIGNPSQINFSLTGSGDNVTTLGEFAPDSGVWNYQIAIATTGPTGATGPTGVTGPPPVKLAETKPVLSKPTAGKTFTASATVTNNGASVEGTVNCSAKLGGKTLSGARHSVGATGKATCSWKLPKSAHGKSLTGRIGESYQGKSVSKPFSAKVK